MATLQKRVIIMCNLAENYILTGVPWRGQESVGLCRAGELTGRGMTWKGPRKPGEGLVVVWCRGGAPVSHFALKARKSQQCLWVHLCDRMSNDKEGVRDRREARQHGVQD